MTVGDFGKTVIYVNPKPIGVTVLIISSGTWRLKIFSSTVKKKPCQKKRTVKPNPIKRLLQKHSKKNGQTSGRNVIQRKDKSSRTIHLKQ